MGAFSSPKTNRKQIGKVGDNSWYRMSVSIELNYDTILINEILTTPKANEIVNK